MDGRRSRQFSVVRRAPIATALFALAACTSGSIATTTTSAVKIPTAAAGRNACALLDAGVVHKLTSAAYLTPQPSGGSGWISSQCTFASASGGPTVSLAVGTAASLKATGYAGSVADFIAKRRAEDARNQSIGPVDGIGADAGYLTRSPAPLLVAYRGELLVQLLSVDISGKPVAASVALALGRSVLEHAG